MYSRIKYYVTQNVIFPLYSKIVTLSSMLNMCPVYKKSNNNTNK